MLAGGSLTCPSHWVSFQALGGEGGECSGKGYRGGHVTDGRLHMWDVVAVEDLRDFIAEGMSSSWALLIFLCVFIYFFNLWQHRTDCDPRMHL